jgi:hypothetical protein
MEVAEACFYFVQIKNLSERIMCSLCHVINWCGDVTVHALRLFCLTCKRASHVDFQELEI